MGTAKESQNSQQFASDFRDLNFDISFPTRKSVSPLELDVPHKAIDISCAPQKKFLIFDQSGNRTRLFFSPSFSTQNPLFPSKIPSSGNGSCAKVVPRVGQQFLVEEKLDEDHFSDKEDEEMLADSEEIDALLYSDGDDDDDAYHYDSDSDTDIDNDDVTSKLQDPFIIQNGSQKENLIEDLIEEVASSDDSPKRQKLLDGSHKKTSWASSYCYEDDVASCAIDSSKREKKVRLRDALKILETIIPGLKSKNPLSVIDNSIAYLKSLKTEAEALELSHPRGQISHFSLVEQNHQTKG